MAGLGDLLQRVARSLEEASAARPADDLRARLGYGTGDEDDEELAEDAVWEPETEPETGRGPPTARTLRPTWTPTASRAPVAGTPQAYATHRASAAEDARRRAHAPTAAPPRSHATSASRLADSIRARLSTPEALREAFVVKEILDRPLGRRRRREHR